MLGWCMLNPIGPAEAEQVQRHLLFEAREASAGEDGQLPGERGGRKEQGASD